MSLYLNNLKPIYTLKYNFFRNNISRVAADSVENISVDQTILERRRASAQSSQNIGNPSPIPDIPAATAVAGRVAASQDLPYMTPPITQPQHFSGDSQDSSSISLKHKPKKPINCYFSGGYTSISVREPLANILSQTPAIRNRRTDLDPHYSTVSDDSGCFLIFSLGYVTFKCNGYVTFK